jgi:hypothetical protein
MPNNWIEDSREKKREKEKRTEEEKNRKQKYKRFTIQYITKFEKDFRKQYNLRK